MSNDLWTGKAARQPMILRLSVPGDFDAEDRTEIADALAERLFNLRAVEGFDVRLVWGEDVEVQS